MRLLDLEPRWIHPNVFIFRCPCCVGTERALWLSCKDVPMKMSEQLALCLAEHDAGRMARGDIIVQTRQEVAWSISSRDFASMSVSPSLDYSNARHWHGHIIDGVIR